LFNWPIFPELVDGGLARMTWVTFSATGSGVDAMSMNRAKALKRRAYY